MTAEKLRLRSYRSAFQLERRIHRVDRFRIPVPYGLPLVAVGWWSAGVLAVLIATRLPVIGLLLGLLPWPVRLLLLPGVIARVLCVVGSDGRPAYEQALARIRFLVAPRVVVGFAAAHPSRIERIGDVWVASDERGSRLQPAVIRGAGPVLVGRPARGSRSRRGIRLAATDDRWLARPRRLELTGETRLDVRCAPR